MNSIQNITFNMKPDLNTEKEKQQEDYFEYGEKNNFNMIQNEEGIRQEA